MKKILCVGDLNTVSRSRQRFRAVKDLGYDVREISYVSVPTVPGVSPWPNIGVRILHKLGYPLDETGINEKLPQAVKEFLPDLLWIEKGLMIKPKTLLMSKSVHPKLKLALWAEENVIPRHNRSAYYTRCIPLYDIIFTPRSVNLHNDGLPSFGAKKVVFVDEGYDRYVHRPLTITDDDLVRYGAGVGFIGTFEQDRAEKMLYLAKNGIRVRVWGNLWNKWVGRHPNLQVENRPLYEDDYVRGLCATKINLCFLRKMNRDMQTNRTMEIPACGAFMLAERTADHLRLFEEGKEAEFFDSEQELLEKIRYYLSHDQERISIARLGRERCIKDEYSHHHRLARMLNEIKKLFHNQTMDVVESWRELLKVKGYEQRMRSYKEYLKVKEFSRLWRRLFIIMGISPEAKKQNNVLEAGCGGASHLVQFALNGWECTGVDCVKEVLGRAENYLQDAARISKKRLRVKFICEDFLNFNSVERFDLVFNVGVIEHILDSAERIRFLRKMFDLAKPGAYIISVVPSGEHSLRKEMKEKGLGGYIIPEIDYTADLMLKELQDLGGVNITISGHNLFGYLLFKKNKLYFLKKIIYLLWQTIPISRLSSDFVFRHSGTLIGIAKKPDSLYDANS